MEYKNFNSALKLPQHIMLIYHFILLIFKVNIGYIHEKDEAIKKVCSTHTFLMLVKFKYLNTTISKSYLFFIQMKVRFTISYIFFALAYLSFLRASIGDFLDAIIAGINPDITDITMLPITSINIYIISNLAIITLSTPLKLKAYLAPISWT